MSKYRKKPVVIEAEHFTDENKDRCFNFVTCNKAAVFGKDGHLYIEIHTLEGVMVASLGDYIIKGVSGEFYPCKSDIFEATYERVTDDERTDSVSEVRGDEAP